MGKEYVNTKGNVVREKSNTNGNCDYKEQCTSKISFSKTIAVFKEFHDGRQRINQIPI